MRHAGTQEIETPRLILRRLLPEDANRMYVNWANDPDVTRFLRWEPHKNAAETRQLLEAWATLYPNEDYYQWAIVEKATGQVFGSISIYNSLLGEPQQKAAWPGLDLSEGIWEPGYCHAAATPASGRVMQKAGFVYHHDAEYHKFDGTPVSCKCYALTREHYNTLYK